MISQACNEYRAVAAGPATTEVVRAHAELVRRIAYHLAARLPASVDVNDLIQAGMIGLIEASRQFRPDQGASFPTYAALRIRGAMIDEIRRSDWVPRGVHRRMREAAEALRRLEQRKGQAATAAEVAAAMGLPLADYLKLLESAARGQVLSLEAQVEESGEPRLAAAAPAPETQLERSEFRRELAAAIAALPEREQLVLSLYYEQEMNLKEIGAVLGVSESRVSQVHGQAMLRLRARLAEWSADDALA